MLRLYNTLTRQQEPFAPLQDGVVRMYACGPTVYARAHIGNFRTFICVDVLRRTLEYHCGYREREAVNYTDVDDKTIDGARQRIDHYRRTGELRASARKAFEAELAGEARAAVEAVIAILDGKAAPIAPAAPPAAAPAGHRGGKSGGR